MEELLGFIVLSGPLFFVAVFFVLSLIIARLAYAMGKRAGRWTLIGLLLLWFWDLPVVWGTFYYQCETQGGFTEYKSVEQWKNENPGAAETLVPYEGTDFVVEGNRTRHLISQRFARDWIDEEWPMALTKQETRIVDVETGEVLARYVDMRSGKGWFNREIDWWNPREFKFWLNAKSCEQARRPEKIAFNGYGQSLKSLGRGKNGS